MFSEGEGSGSTFAIEIPIIIKESHAVDIGNDDEGSPADTFRAPREITLYNNSSKCRQIVPVTCETCDDTIESKSFPSTLPASQLESGGSCGPCVEQSASKYGDSPTLHALMVDDSRMSRKMVRKALKDKFVSIREAEDGAIAVGVVRELLGQCQPLDVIVMDYQMPNMDGPTASKEIRALGYKGLIIGLTGNALPEDIATFKAHGVDEVLTKPVDTDAFDEIIARGNLSLL